MGGPDSTPESQAPKAGEPNSEGPGTGNASGYNELVSSPDNASSDASKRKERAADGASKGPPGAAGAVVPAFSADVAVELEEEGDLLGHGDYADALASAALDTDGHFTFGLFGEWGMGKSTVLKTLKARLKDNDTCAFVMFDAWRYQGDSFRREFLRELSNQLGDQEALPKKKWNPSKELGRFDEDESRVEDEGLELSSSRLILSMLGVAVALTLAAVLGSALAGAKPFPVAAVLLPLVAFLALRAEAAFRIRERTVSRRRLEDPDRFAAVFRRLVGAIDRRRLVVAIDNLDRCTPEEALEILATIKTYLEPEVERVAEKGTSQQVVAVTFLIAVDEQALRNHLSRSYSPADETTGQRRAFVDEYLRKFFNATTTLRPLVSGDVRAYLRELLAPIIERAEIANPDPIFGTDVPTPEVQLEQVVDMCLSGLGGNPRRARQFAHNLELQLRLIRARERERPEGARIRPKISDNVAMVGKLELMEELWPAPVRELRRNYQLLSEWHAGIDGEEPPRGIDDKTDWQALAPFLRTTRRVQTPHLRAFLRLKLSEAEARLDGYEEFRELVLDAELDEIEIRLDGRARAEAEAAEGESPFYPDSKAHSEDRDEQRERAALLPDILAEELEAGHIDAAVNVVRCTLGLEIFSEHKEVRTRVLSEAVADSRTRTELPELQTDLLVAAALDLPGPEQPPLFAELARAVSAADIEEPKRREMVAVLVNNLEVLDERGREALKASLGEASLVDNFALLSPVAAADPDLLPEAASHKAFDHLNSVPAAGLPSPLSGPRDSEAREAAMETAREQVRHRISSDASNPALSVLVAGARSGHFSGRGKDLTNLFAALLSAIDGDSAGFRRLSRSSVEVVAALDGVEENDILNVVAALGAVRAASEDAAPHAIHAAGELLDSVGSDQANMSREFLADTEPTVLANYVLAHPADLPRSLYAPLLRALRGDGSDDPQRRKPEDRKAQEVALALATLDREVLGRSVNADDLAVAINDWAEGGPVPKDQLWTIAADATGIALDNVRSVVCDKVTSVTPVHGYEPDPADYTAMVTLVVGEALFVADPPHEVAGEDQVAEVECPVKLRMKLWRASEDVIEATVYGIEPQPGG